MRKVQIWTLCVHYSQICVCEFILYQYMTHKTPFTHILVQVIIKYWPWLALPWLKIETVTWHPNHFQTVGRNHWLKARMEEWWESKACHVRRVNELLRLTEARETIFRGLVRTLNRERFLKSRSIIRARGPDLESSPSECKLLQWNVLARTGKQSYLFFSC